MSQFFSDEIQNSVNRAHKSDLGNFMFQDPFSNNRRTGRKRCSSRRQQPMTGRRRCTSRRQQPVTSRNRRTSRQQQPMTGRRRCTSRRQQPVTSRNRRTSRRTTNDW